MKVVSLSGPRFPPIDFLGSLDPTTIKPVQFLYGFFYARGYTSLTIAAPKVGKSLLTIAEAVDMASGGAVFGRRFDPLRVLYFNGEDGLAEIEARVAAVCLNAQLEISEITGTLSIVSGADWPDFHLVGSEAGHAFVFDAAFQHLEARVAALDLDVVIFDPLQDLSRADESNETFRLLGQRLRGTAQRLGVAIGLVHHTRKLGPGLPVTIDDARGGSALRGTSRFNRVLTTMSANEGTLADVDDHRRFFRIGEVESNLAPPSSEANCWFCKVSVDLPNGQSVGAVSRWAWPDAFDGVTSEMVAEVRDEIGSMPEERCRKDPQAKEWVGQVIARVVGIDLDGGNDEGRRKAARARVRRLIEQWVRAGFLEVGVWRDKEKSKNREVLRPGPNYP